MESPDKKIPLVPANTEQLLAELEQLSKQIKRGKELDPDRGEQGLVIKGK